jgi:replicative DNA helicase
MATQEKSSESGLDDHQKAILATYDKVGKFDLKRLQVTVLESGLRVLDKHKFLTKDQARLITVGAHTSHGKSALLMQLAAHVSITEPVIVHSFEMGTDETESRLLAAISGIPSTLIQEGSAHKAKVDAARADFANRKLYMSNIQNRSLNYVMSSIYELSKIVGRPGLVVIDYGQQVKPGGAGARTTERVTEITDISAGLLQLAQQLKCNVLVGAQLNNEVLKRAYGSKDEDGNMEYVPIISDVREGSSIAHDSSTVLMVVRPNVFDRKAPKDTAFFYCVKNRGGELWDSAVKWDGPKCMFYEESRGL